MTILIAAFLIGAAVSIPPEDDDDTPRAARAAATAVHPQSPTAKGAAAGRTPSPDKDDHQEKVRAPSRAREGAADGDDEEEARSKAAGATASQSRTPDARTQEPGRASDEGDDDRKPGARSGRGKDEADEDDEEEEGRLQPANAIIVTAHRLDAARTQIDAALGASVYSLTNDTIENRPGGETGSVSDILQQAPGVTLSGSTLTVRGSRANQVRINNVIVPEAISDPADLISSRLAQSSRLITGTLPSQFGFAPAGVISITTKNGLYQHGGELELFAGTGGMVEPAIEWAGSAGHSSLFASGELERDRSTIADIEGIRARDRRTGIDGLGFADHVIDDQNRLSFIFGGAHEHHRIGETSLGAGTRNDDNGYGVATFQHSESGFTLQTSLFAGVGADDARFTTRTRERRSSWGTQVDASGNVGRAHVLRFGLLATRFAAHELDSGGDRTSARRTSLALYGQDEWKLAASLTFNPGVRVEWLRAFASSATIEPRASLVWQSDNGLSAHLGYARYAAAPPLGEGSSSLPDERDDYLDVGIQKKLGPLTLGIDAYWRSARNYLAEHEVPGSAAGRAFAFRHARIRGAELSATYARRGTTAWANLSLATSEARTIIGGQALFAPETIAAASGTFVPLASDRPVTLSGGATQRVGRFSIGGDILATSGAVRTLDLADPNGDRRSAYALLGLAGVYHARIAGHPADLRLDLTNLTNVRYATSDAANLEGGWTHFGRGRAITIGIEQRF